MIHCGRKSKFEIGDKVYTYDITGEIVDIGILGSKLSDWVFVYSIIDKQKKRYCLIDEKLINKLC